MMKAISRGIATAAVLFLVATLAPAADIPIAKGMPLDAMHTRLLQAGWKPAATSVYLSMTNPSSVAAIRHAGYPVQECAGTGRNPCIFYYKKMKACLRIVTLGEFDPPEAEPVVDSWSFACPGK